MSFLPVGTIVHIIGGLEIITSGSNDLELLTLFSKAGALKRCRSFILFTNWEVDFGRWLVLASSRRFLIWVGKVRSTGARTAELLYSHHLLCHLFTGTLRVAGLFPQWLAAPE